MRHKLLVTATLVTSLLLVGCMRPMASTAVQSDIASVSVRFIMPPASQRLTEAGTSGQTNLVVDESYNGFAGEERAGYRIGRPSESHHVVLWGGPFQAGNVTYGVASLPPGPYTFAFFERDQGDVMQGWLDVHSAGNDVLDVLNKWKSGIQAQEQRLAYDFDINERMAAGNPLALESFRKQLRAIKQLKQGIKEAIAAELQADTARERRSRDFLRQADILMLPGGDEFFHQTTQPAISKDDLETVRAGGVVTKIILVADHQDAIWKLRRVNQLYGDLLRYRQVLNEEIDRLRRRKGLFLLTDHLHDNDRKFLQNEVRLQRTLGSIDGLSEQMADLRVRRIGLAFITGLFAADGAFGALDQEDRDLSRELAVLEAELRRFDLLADEADESSVKRVAFEHSRQRTAAAIETINRQVEQLSQARTALASMIEATRVIHRQGDMRLLTTTFVDVDLPLAVREAVERESMMTVRLEVGENVFVPTRTTVTSAHPGTAYTPAFGYPPSTGYERSAPRFRVTAAVEEDQFQLAHNRQRPAVTQDDEPDRDENTGKGFDCPPLIRLLVPPCWFAGGK